ncbi:MAG: hypothetical protein U0V70_14055 [Terriglobia bacterium]
MEWDGLPDRRWQGKVERTAQQVVPLGNRSVGYVYCSVAGSPAELIPNLNPKIRIVTGQKSAALIIPRAAVFNHRGASSVLLEGQGHPQVKTVVLGMVTPQDVEILQGLEEGNQVIINPGDVPLP